MKVLCFPAWYVNSKTCVMYCSCLNLRTTYHRCPYQDIATIIRNQYLSKQMILITAGQRKTTQYVSTSPLS